MKPIKLCKAGPDAQPQPAAHTPGLKKGMVVMVYSDPITKKKPEGKAVLDFKEQIADQDPLEFWSVQFQGEDGWFTRWIDPSDAEGRA